MRAKRLDIRAIFVAVAVGLVFPASDAKAQQSGGVWRLSPEPNGTRAVEARKEPTVVVVSEPRIPQRHVFPRFPVLVTLVPAILMSDGSVFANFGFGYEPVYRSCSGAVVVGQPTVVASNGVVLSQPQRPTYTQPVPNQQTASQQFARANLAGTAVVSDAAQSSCFNRDASGRVFVYRF